MKTRSLAPAVLATALVLTTTGASAPDGAYFLGSGKMSSEADADDPEELDEDGFPESDFGSGAQPFEVVARDTTSNFWILLALWAHAEREDLGAEASHMGIPNAEGLAEFGNGDLAERLENNETIGDFDAELIFIGNRLRVAMNSNLSHLDDRGLTAGYRPAADGGDPIEDAEDQRRESHDSWVAAVEELPIEDIETYADDVVNMARQWALYGSESTSSCRSVSSTEGGDDGDSGGDESSSGGGSGSSGGLDMPEEYAEYIESAAELSGFPAELLAAQIQQESGWNPDAVSPVGAEGIAQFMPGTWAEFGEGDIFDAEASIEAQGRYMNHLREFVEPHSGSEEETIELALAAYNAGPGAVQDAGWSTPPFDETQHYVEHIPELAGGDLNISTSNCISDVDVPDLADVDCEAYQEGAHRDYQGARSGPNLRAPDGDRPYIEDIMHPAAVPGAMCGMVAFSAEYDGILVNSPSPFGAGSSNDFSADVMNNDIPGPGELGNDHPWGGGLDILLADAEGHDGGQFYWTPEGQEYGREIAEFYMEHADELNVFMVIYWEKQWMATEDPKPWDEWDVYGGSAGSWSPQGSPGDSLGEEYGTYVESPNADSLAHRNHPHISFDPHQADDD